MKYQKNINRLIDHTLLKPDATAADIENLCREARENNFYAVCVNPTRVSMAARLLKDSDTVVACVCGFPLGATFSAFKAMEAAEAIKNGASEIDMVINVGWLKDGRYDEVRRDIELVVDTIDYAVKSMASDGKPADVALKVIIENCLLTDSEKAKACELALDAGATWVKTSTGFAGGGATVEDVALMRKVVGNRGFIKASGGIRDLETALAMIEAGADRIGASASIKIIEEMEEKWKR